MSNIFWLVEGFCPQPVIFLGDLLPSGKLYYTKSSKEDYHVFWDNAFSGQGAEDNSTMIVSTPTNDITPLRVDFFEMRWRYVPFVAHYDYGPMGIQIPLIEHKGTGLFHFSDKR